MNARGACNQRSLDELRFGNVRAKKNVKTGMGLKADNGRIRRRNAGAALVNEAINAVELFYSL